MQELENITNEEIDNKSDIVNDLFEKLNSEDLQKVLGLLGGSLLRVVTDTNYLSKPVLPSEFTDDEIKQLSALLTIHLKRYGGIGLSANQLGIDKRICIVNVKEPLVLVNPVITEYSSESLVYNEACLSIPKTMKKPKTTVRAKSVTVKTDNLGEIVFTSEKDEYKTFEDLVKDLDLLECVTVQHEIDHLNGILITDKRRIYSTQFVNDGRKYGRNDRVMIKSADGKESKFLKYKNALPYIKEFGYILQ